MPLPPSSGAREGGGGGSGGGGVGSNWFAIYFGMRGGGAEGPGPYVVRSRLLLPQVRPAQWYVALPGSKIAGVGGWWEGASWRGRRVGRGLGSICGRRAQLSGMYEALQGKVPGSIPVRC